MGTEQLPRPDPSTFRPGRALLGSGFRTGSLNAALPPGVGAGRDFFPPSALGATPRGPPGRLFVFRPLILQRDWASLSRCPGPVQPFSRFSLSPDVSLHPSALPGCPLWPPRRTPTLPLSRPEARIPSLSSTLPEQEGRGSPRLGTGPPQCPRRRTGPHPRGAVGGSGRDGHSTPGPFPQSGGSQDSRWLATLLVPVGGSLRPPSTRNVCFTCCCVPAPGRPGVRTATLTVGQMPF